MISFRGFRLARCLQLLIILMMCVLLCVCLMWCGVGPQASSPTVRSSAASPEPHSHHGSLHVHSSPDVSPSLHDTRDGLRLTTASGPSCRARPYPACPRPLLLRQPPTLSTCPPPHPSPSPQSAHGHGHGRGQVHAGEDPLHDKVANIGSRRATPLASHAGDGALFSSAELQAQLRKQAEQLAAGAQRLQEAELALIKSKQEKAHLEQVRHGNQVGMRLGRAGGRAGAGCCVKRNKPGGKVDGRGFTRSSLAGGLGGSVEGRGS